MLKEDNTNIISAGEILQSDTREKDMNVTVSTFTEPLYQEC